MNKEGKEKVYEPKMGSDYRGKDAATIVDMGNNIFMPIYLSASANGLAQAIKSNSKRVITFNRINSDFHNEVVIPLVEKMKERGVAALDDLNLPDHKKKN